MSDRRTRFLKSSLDIIHGAQLHKLIGSIAQGTGLIFTLHHVKPKRDMDFHPNELLEVTPDFLDGVLTRVKELGLDLVSMDEAVERLQSGQSDKRFVVVTFDDGYKDNLTYALPVLEKHQCPFTIYIPTEFIEGRGEPWWLALEEIIANENTVVLYLEGRELVFDTSNLPAKHQAYQEIYWWLRQLNEHRMRHVMRSFCQQYNYDMTLTCRREVMDLTELMLLAQHPLATIGAHTKTHPMLAKMHEEDAYMEMQKGREKLYVWLGQKPQHFSYPYGDFSVAGKREFELAKDLGFKTAVTTRKGVLFPEHKDHLHALPRVSLNGFYQDLKYIDLYVSGAPFVLSNKFRKLAVS
jgi:peptidoglycan/xylan/chitin deacetylase (PgdA/CDA1 family)